MKLTALLPLVGWVGGCLSGCKQQLFPLTWWELKWSAWLNDYDDSELPTPTGIPPKTLLLPLQSAVWVGARVIIMSPRDTWWESLLHFPSPPPWLVEASKEGLQQQHPWETRVPSLTTAAWHESLWALCLCVRLPRQNVCQKETEWQTDGWWKGVGQCSLVSKHNKS